MNRLFFFTAILITILSCKTINSVLKVSQLESSRPIIIKLNKKKNELVHINIPLKFVLENKSEKKSLSFSSISYKDFETSSISSSLLYEFIEDSLIKLTKDKYKFIKPKETKNYILYTQHYLDSVSREKLNYLKEKNINSDITINDIDSFKMGQQELLKKLTHRDSIYIRVKENDKISTMKYPVEF